MCIGWTEWVESVGLHPSLFCILSAIDTSRAVCLSEWPSRPAEFVPVAGCSLPSFLHLVLRS